MEWKGYKNYDHYFNASDYEDFIQELGELPIVTKSNNLSYYNIPASFDIETTSTYVKDAKFAFMYIWQLCINGSTIIGRKWEEFLLLLKILKERYNISQSKRMIIYVHNLGFEFQFFRKRITWAKKDGKDCVFSLKSRRPIYALSQLGFEFRCSYLLSNYNLAYLGANMLLKYKVRKKVGDLDYSLIRTPETPLTEEEIGYCYSDVQVVTSYIQEQIESMGGSIVNIPLTSTGYVREYCRNYCYGAFESDSQLRKKMEFEYHSIISNLTIKSAKEYRQLKDAFAGGFTHPNPAHVNKIIPNMESEDLASSYPATMCSDYFPMSSSTYIGDVKDLSRFNFLLQNYCCLFTVVFYDIYSTFESDSYISLHKAQDISDDYVVNAGRIVSADFLQITTTEVDFDIIKKVYDWSKIEIHSMRIYERGYLPRRFILSILHLFQQKTTLKDVEGKEVEYMASKNKINASFGMSVTDIVRDENFYIDDLWEKQQADPVSQLTDYNKSYNRFLFYPWGVWVTAHARHNLWEAILELGDDFVYADTDSVKFTNYSSHEEFFKRYNFRIKGKLLKMCIYYKINPDLIEPKTKKGKKKLLGVWERERSYKKFKTIGPKRYIYEYEDGEFSMTTSGVNKKSAVPYLLVNYCNYPEDLTNLAYSPDPNLFQESKEAMEKLLKWKKENNISTDAVFDAFDNNLHIPKGKSGKLTHAYIDDFRSAKITDYLGKTTFVSEFSATHLEPAAYDFSISEIYLKFLAGITQHEI
jgi:hypothetical protein